MQRRQMLQLAGGSLLALSTAGCTESQLTQSTGDQDDFALIKDPFFVVDKNGEALGDRFRVDEPNDEVLFDPLGEGPPLRQIVELGVQEYSGSEVSVAGNTFTPEIDAELFVPGIVDSRRLVTKPPEGYNPDNPDDTGTWPACTWNDYRHVRATANLTLVDDNGDPASGDATVAGTEFEVTVRDGIPNGLYTFWVVKVGSDGVVGFHPLGDNSGGDNILRLDENGDGTTSVVNTGGPINATPGFAGIPRNESIPANIVDANANIWLAAAYHYDDQTWGFYPGPNHMVHFRLVFASN